MDPYLERPALWPDLHERLAYTISEVLQPVLPARYYAQLQHREEVGVVFDEPAHTIVPDVVVLEAQAQGAGTGNASAVAAGVTAPVVVRWDHEPVRHPFVEIRDLRGDGRVVAVIELVSPSNKAKGPDREAYLRKQAEVLASEAHLIEVDLLRAGERLVVEPRVRAWLASRRDAAHYVVHVSHAGERAAPAPRSRVYAFSVRDPLPTVELPLLPGDAPVALDLPRAFARAYDSGPYAKVVDYQGEPAPPLGPEDQAWARARLATPRQGSSGGDAP